MIVFYSQATFLYLVFAKNGAYNSKAGRKTKK